MTDKIIAYSKTTDKPIYLAGDLNEWPHSLAIKAFKDNGFVILNDSSTYTYPRSNPWKILDMILEYKSGSLIHNILSRGIPNFPREDLRGCSDHLPYYVTVLTNN